MNICSITNRVGAFIEYSLGHDNTKTNFDEYSLPEVILIWMFGIVFALTVSWWTIPIRIFIVKSHMDEIVFKCEKRN